MDIKSCKLCGKLFQFRGNYYCADCIHKMDELFTNVRNYMYNNPGATIEDICDETGVTEDMVMEWLREGRLLTTKDSVPLLKCGSCGKPIFSGRYCKDCTGGVINRFEETSKKLSSDIERQRLNAEKRGYHTER